MQPSLFPQLDYDRVLDRFEARRVLVYEPFPLQGRPEIGVLGSDPPDLQLLAPFPRSSAGRHDRRGHVGHRQAERLDRLRVRIRIEEAQHARMLDPFETGRSGKLAVRV